MRWTLLAIAFYGCGCSAPDTVGYETEPAEMITEEVRVEGLCFALPSGVEGALPTLRSVSHEAAAAWGVPFDTESCPNWFAVTDELSRPELDAAMSRDKKTGSLVFRFKRSSLHEFAATEESCSTYVDDDGVEKWQTPLMQIVLHEFGHALGFRGNDPEDPKHALSGVMAARHDSGCSVLWPSKTDKSSLFSSVD